jgi:hypothetical protein
LSEKKFHLLALSFDISIYDMSNETEGWPPFAIPFSDLIAGSAGGAAQVIVGQPLDTIKTRAQTSPPGMFKGPTDILMQTIRKEGFFALYKGEQYW